MEKNTRDFDKRKKAKDKKIEDGDQVIVARRKTTTKTPWNPNPYGHPSQKGHHPERVEQPAD